MRSLLECAALLASALPNQTSPEAKPAAPAPVDASEAVRALAERTQEIVSFFAVYHVTGFDGVEQEIRFWYRAPDRARFDVTNQRESRFVWLHDSRVAFRGKDRNGSYAAEYDLADGSVDGGCFEEMLDREFGGPRRARGPANGPSFRIDIAPSTFAEEGVDGPIVINVGWNEPVFHLMAWLDGGSAASPWKAEGDEFVRRTPKGGVVRVSKATGLLVSLTYPGGYEVRAVRTGEEVREEDLAVPAVAQLEEDRSSKMEQDFQYARLRKHRRDVYAAALLAASEKSAGIGKGDTRLIRAFSFVDRPICRWMDRAYGAQNAANVATFASWSRDQRDAAGDSPEGRVEVDAAIEKWKSEYVESVDAYGSAYLDSIESPLDEDDPVTRTTNASKRIDAILSVERATFGAMFREMVRKPVIARVENALRTAEARH